MSCRSIWLLLALVWLWSIPSLCQVITASEEVDLRNSVSYFIIGELQETYQVIRDLGTQQYVDVFDGDLKLMNSKDLSLSSEPTRILEAFGYKNYVYIVFRERVRQKTKINVAKYTGYGELVDTVSLMVKSDFLSLGVSGVYRSPLGSKLLVSHAEKRDLLALTVLDLENFEVLYSDGVEFNSVPLPGGLYQALVDDAGSTTLIANTSDGSLLRREVSLDLLRLYMRDTLENYYNSLTIEDRYVSEFRFVQDYVNGGLFFVGFGSDRRTERSDFSFVGKVSPELTLISFKEYPFAESILRSIYGTQKRMREFIEGLRLRDLLILEDGSVLVLSEIAKTYSRRGGLTTGQIGALGGAWTDYYYEDVMALCIDSAGERLWSDVFHKRQFSQDDGGVFSSFFLMKNPSSLRLVYNDDVRQESTISEYIITPDGYSERNSLFTADQNRVLLRFRDGVQVGAAEYIIPSERSSLLSLVRVKYLADP